MSAGKQLPVFFDREQVYRVVTSLWIPLKTDITGNVLFKFMRKKLVSWHKIVRVEREPVVIIGKKIAFTAHALSFISKTLP